jgi:hypothetical protein
LFTTKNEEHEDSWETFVAFVSSWFAVLPLND